jgi:hypothetical protein
LRGRERSSHADNNAGGRQLLVNFNRIRRLIQNGEIPVVQTQPGAPFLVTLPIWTST